MASFIRQQDPQRIRAKRRSKRQDQQVDDGQAEHQHTAGGLPPAEQHAGADVHAAPDERDRTHHGEGGCRDTRRQADRRTVRTEEDCQRAGRQQQQRYADDHRQRAPERTQNGENSGVALHAVSRARED